MISGYSVKSWKFQIFPNINLLTFKNIFYRTAKALFRIVQSFGTIMRRIYKVDIFWNKLLMRRKFRIQYILTYTKYNLLCSKAAKTKSRNFILWLIWSVKKSFNICDKIFIRYNSGIKTVFLKGKICSKSFNPTFISTPHLFPALITHQLRMLQNLNVFDETSSFIITNQAHLTFRKQSLEEMIFLWKNCYSKKCV